MEKAQALERPDLGDYGQVALPLCLISSTIMGALIPLSLLLRVISTLIHVVHQRATRVGHQ